MILERKREERPFRSATTEEELATTNGGRLGSSTLSTLRAKRAYYVCGRNRFARLPKPDRLKTSFLGFGSAIAFAVASAEFVADALSLHTAP